MRTSLALLTLAAAALAACQQDPGLTDPSAGIEASRMAAPHGAAGAVYTLTNDAAGNAVAVYGRAPDGALRPSGTVATNGQGTGGALGSQGAIVLSDDGRWLFAVNAGSNDVSVFSLRSGAPSLVSRTPSGGTSPISVTVHGDVVYVLNARGDGNITGFTRDWQGGLTPIEGSTQPLSSDTATPAQVSFSPDGRWLVVTEKNTSLVDLYAVDWHGVARKRASVASAGGVPYGFAFGRRNLLFVSEAAGEGSASSYILSWTGQLRVASGAVPTHQGAPCWAVVTKNGRFGYTANATGGSISGFSIARNGAITLLDADGATAHVGAGAIDMALSGNSRFLYQLVGGASPTIHAFRVAAGGQLAPVGVVGGLPASAGGLAAR